MRILAISDIHGRVDRFGRLHARLQAEGFTPDVVVVAGDITYFKDLDTAVRILRELKSVFNSKILFVPGNCDSRDILGIDEVEQNLANIHARALRVDEYVFYGIGGSSITPHRTWIEYSEDEFRGYLRLLEDLTAREPSPSDNLIVVTHQPIHGFFDEIRGERIGSKAFYELLVRLQPLLWVTGHMHEYSGWAKQGRTTIVHPGPLMHNRYAVIEVEKNVVKWVRVSRIEVG